MVFEILLSSSPQIESLKKLKIIFILFFYCVFIRNILFQGKLYLFAFIRKILTLYLHFILEVPKLLLVKNGIFQIAKNQLGMKD
jgi:hypothetical protein